jgi:hypothetical protein
MHQKSNIGNFLIYSFAGVLFLGIIRLFFATVDSGLLQIDEMTVMICWHLMFYLTMTLFLVATRALVVVLDINYPPKEQLNPFILPTLAGLGILLLFYFSPVIDKSISPLVEGTWIEMSGIAHFIAFTYAGGVAYYLLRIKEKYSGSIGKISTPLLISLSILSLIHLLELLGESWHILPFNHEYVEVTESLLMIPFFLLVGVAYWKLKKTLSVTL